MCSGCVRKGYGVSCDLCDWNDEIRSESGFGGVLGARICLLVIYRFWLFGWQGDHKGSPLRGPLLWEEGVDSIAAFAGFWNGSFL